MSKPKPTYPDRITYRRTPPIAAADVIRFEGDNNYTRVYVRGYKHPFLFALTLGVMCARCPWIVRVHKQYAVNPAYVEQTDNASVILAGGVPVTVSRRCSLSMAPPRPYRSQVNAQLAIDYAKGN